MGSKAREKYEITWMYIHIIKKYWSTVFKTLGGVVYVLRGGLVHDV